MLRDRAQASKGDKLKTTLRAGAATLGALYVLMAAGCGSDDTNEPEPEQANKPAPASAERPKSHRAQMVDCIEGVGFSATTDGDPNNISIESPNGTVQAVIIVHAAAARAKRSAAQGRSEDGLDDVAIGRAEFITHAADEREARVIASCVADEYG